MKKILLAITLAVVATACHTNEESSDVQLGKIAINATTRGDVTEANTTGKTVLDESLVPSENDLKVEVSGNGTTQAWATYSEFEQALNEGLTFPSAPHTITLSYGEKGVEGWSKPYFEGSKTVEVPMYGLSVDADIVVGVANSIVSVETSEKFDGYFPKSSFKINGVDWDASKKELLFMNTGEITFTCEAIRPTGKPTTFEGRLLLKAATHHKIVFELSTAGKAVVNITFDDEIVETIELEFELNENA